MQRFQNFDGLLGCRVERSMCAQNPEGWWLDESQRTNPGWMIKSEIKCDKTTVRPADKIERLNVSQFVERRRERTAFGLDGVV
jgi:hypothetical protein